MIVSKSDKIVYIQQVFLCYKILNKSSSMIISVFDLINWILFMDVTFQAVDDYRKRRKEEVV